MIARVLVVLVAAAGLTVQPLTTTTPGVVEAAGRGTFAFTQSFDRGLTYRLMTSDLLGGSRRAVTTQRAVGRPAFAPGGHRLAFSGPVTDDSDGRYGIHVVNSDGTALRRITAPRFADFDPAWSRDGQRLAFSRDNRGNSHPPSCCVLVVSAADGSGSYEVAGTTGGTFPAWSPDGRWLAYVHPTGLWVARADGGGSRQVFRGRVESPAWSPDGRYLAFVLRQSSTESRLAIITPSGGTPALRAGISGLIEDPTWDDDNRTIYFAAYRGLGDDGRTRADVYRSAGNGGPVSRLFTLPQAIHRLAFTPGVPSGTTGLGAVGVVDGRLQWSMSNATDAPAEAQAATYGVTGNIPFAGDWDGDGTETPGVVNVRDGVLEWYLTNEAGAAPRTAARLVYGIAGNVPVVGDWDGDGRDSIGVANVRDNTLEWYLSNRTDQAVTAARFAYGIATNLPVTGDWDGDGRDSVGVAHRVGEELQWFLSNRTVGAATSYKFSYGTAAMTPVTGDWEGNGSTTVGVVDRSQGRLDWSLATTSTAPGFTPPVPFGGPEDVPVTGNWDGR